MLFAEVIEGGAVTVNVNDCVAFGETPLFAVTVNVCAPDAVVEAIVITPVDGSIVTPAGAPVSEYAIVASPVAVTVNVPPAPYARLVLFADVIVGATLTVSVNNCSASGSTPLLAISLNVCTPTAVDDAMVITPVDAFIVTPAGAPVSEYVLAGWPVDVTVNVPPAPPATLMLFAEVITGGAVTVNVNDCVAFGETPLFAVTVNVCEPAAVVDAIDITPVDAFIVTPAG
jgi:hypothetical protein